MRGRDEGAQEDEATHIDMQRRRRPQQADDSLPSLSAMLLALGCAKCIQAQLGLPGSTAGGCSTLRVRLQQPHLSAPKFVIERNRAVLIQLSSFASARPGRQGRILTATLTLPADAMVSGVRPACAIISEITELQGRCSC